MADKFDKITNDMDKKASYDAIIPISYVELKAVFDKWLLIVDPGIVKLLAAIIHSNLYPTDPVWVFIIAPSSGGKTELLNAFIKDPACYFLSQLTPNTFLSGYKGSKDREASLLHQLGTNKTIIFKDFTSLLEGNKDAFKDIMGQLREIFDGYLTKRLGTGDELSWKGKLGFIAGCTPILEQKMNLIGAMGERFLSYTIDQPKRQALRVKMRENIGKEGTMRDEIQDAMLAFRKGLIVPEEMPKLPDEVEAMIEALTDFIAISRCVVIRSMDNKRDVEYVAPPEGTGRTFKQLQAVAMSMCQINGGQWFPEDSAVLRKLARSSVHSIRYHLIQGILGYTTQVRTATLAMELGYPTSTIRRYLEDLAAISMDEGAVRILNRTHQGNGKPDLWEVTPEMRNILNTMGENTLGTKEDKDFDKDEEDTPVGRQHNGKYDADKQKEIDELTAGMTPEEIANLGL